MSEKPPIGDEIKIIQQRELDDLDRLAQEIVKPPAQATVTSETPPDMPPVPPVAPPVVVETDPVPRIMPDVPPSVAPKPDSEPVSGEKTAEELKTDLDAKRRIYAQLDLDKSRKWTRLKNLLGSGIKEVKDEDYDRAWGEYEEAKSKYFEVKRADVLNNRDKEGAREFLREFEGADEAIKFLNLKYDLKKEQSGYPAKILYGFEKLANGWKEMSWKKKLAISVAIMGVGFAATATAGLTFGGVGALAFTLRTAQRTLGAGAMYIGAKKWQDTRAMKKTKESSENVIEKEILSQSDWLDRIANLDYGRISERFNLSKKEVEALDKKHKRRALALAGLVGIGGTAFDMYRQGYFGAIKDKLFGGGTQLYPEGKYGPGGYGTENEGHGDIVKSTHERYGYGKYGEAGYGTETEGHIFEPEVKTGGSAQAWAETTPAGGAKVQVPEIVKPQFEDVPVKIKAGGNMWVSIRSNIEANSRAYGLDQTDPQFKAKMNGKITQMLHDFADKKGISYKQLDKVFEGDNFKIKHDMAGNPYLDDFHGKGLGGGHVSHGGAAAQEAVPSKANVSVDDTKPKASVAPEGSRPRTGAVAEHQPSRGAVQVPREDLIKPNGPRLDDGSLSQVNQKPPTYYEQLSPEQKHSYDLAHVQQVNATGKLLCRVFEGAGVSKWADVLNQPMKEWSNLFGPEDQISQDVQLNDATDKVNLNLKKLRELYPILKKYQTRGIESIGECLFKAMKDPANALKINMNVLTSKH